MTIPMSIGQMGAFENLSTRMKLVILSVLARRRHIRQLSSSLNCLGHTEIPVACTGSAQQSRLVHGSVSA